MCTKSNYPPRLSNYFEMKCKGIVNFKVTLKKILKTVTHNAPNDLAWENIGKRNFCLFY